jgi:hypothetical protein
VKLEGPIELSTMRLMVWRNDKDAESPRYTSK